MRTSALTVSVLALLVVSLSGVGARAQQYSVAIGAASPPPPDDILVPGPAPVVFGTAGTPLIEVDAFSYHNPAGIFDDPIFAFIYEFSVDPLAVGVPATAVAIEALGGAGGPGDHPADIYFSAAAGANTQAWDGDGVGNPGVAPPLGLIEPFSGDDVDGWDNDAAVAPFIFFSEGAATLGGGSGLLFADDVYVSPSAAAPYDTAPPAASYTLGLGIPGVTLGENDIDALVIYDDGDVPVGLPVFAAGVDTIVFSLTPTSTLIGTPDSLTGTPISPGDVLVDAATASIIAGGPVPVVPGIIASAESLGLLAVRSGAARDDNLNALDMQIHPIPEPATFLLALFGLGLLGLLRRRFV